jgi:LuxR family maltose regulon positive regulatory protein
MARSTPEVIDNVLSGHGAEPIAVGSPAWYAWLEAATVFAVRGAGGFTARREGRARGGEYWRAYRTVAGRQRRAYLGRSADLTPARLREAAAQLAGETSSARSPTPAPTPTPPDPAGLLLATKLYLPRPRGAQVARPRLLARLDVGLAGPLTLIAAPAGFGKTTLLADWLSKLSIKNEELRKGTSGNAVLNSQFSILHSVAWLSLDENDNDPIVFLRYLIATLQRAIPAPVGLMALALLQSNEPPALTTLITTLINDLAAAPNAWLLVLDDYHVIGRAEIHTGLTFLLDHLPPGGHLVIASREDPPLPLARLRARGQVSELRAADLRFTAEEAAAFLADTMRLPLSPAQVAALDARTEGWAAGLQLAALALQDQSDRAGFIAAFTGSNRFVVDYLAAEVLDRLPGQLRDFMLRTAILDRMCAPLCDAVLENRTKNQEPRAPQASGSWFLVLGSGAPDSQPILDQLDRANLFVIPLDGERRWYRYHQLFADVLREHLGRSLPAAEVAELHRRASQWLADHDQLPAAIHHALSAGDPGMAADLIERTAMPLALEGQHVTVGAWLARLPAGLARTRPQLALAHAYVAGAYFDLAGAERHLADVETAIAGWDAQAAAPIRGEVAALRSLGFSLLGDPRAIGLGQQALAQLPAGHPLRLITTIGLSYAYFYAGDLAATLAALQTITPPPGAPPYPATLAAGIVALLAMTRRAQGRLGETRRLSAEVLALATRDGRLLPLSSVFLAQLLLGLTQCEQNELDAAEQTLRHCVALAGEYQVPTYVVLGQFYLGQVLCAKGDLLAALELVEQAEAAAPRYLSPANLLEFAGYRVLIWLRLGRLDEAAAWAAGANTSAGGRPRFAAYDYDRFAVARVLAAQGRWDAAHAAIAELVDGAAATDHGRMLIWALVLQALLFQASGDTAGALGPLARALALAEPEGYIRVFADEGAPMKLLIADCRLQMMRQTHGLAGNQQAKLLAYIDKLLAAFPNADAQKELSPARSSQLPALLPDPLSAREIDVLRLLAAGYDNAAIASALVVAVSTVKSHINHIFAKLGVASRLAAVRRAEELGLL